MLTLKYYLIYKPFNMLSQFSEVPEGTPVLKSLYNFPKDAYPVGRLDKDSEGLLIITNDKTLNHRLLEPEFAHKREYWVQVEGIPTKEAINHLEKGVVLKEFKTLPAKAAILDPQPVLPQRNPPIRFRQNIPATWISLTLQEGKNRQVRRMTAAVGYPTLRLVRAKIERLEIDDMQPGDIIEMSRDDLYGKLFK